MSLDMLLNEVSAEAKKLVLIIENLQQGCILGVKDFNFSHESDIFEKELPASSIVRYVRYTVSKMTLELTFKRNQRTCVYHNVKFGTFEELMASKSFGAFFNRNVRDIYPCLDKVVDLGAELKVA